MAKMHSLRGLFDEQLKVLYCAEKQFSQVLPKIVDKISSDELKREMEKHIDTQENHFNRIGQVLKDVDVTSEGASCPPMEGIIDEINSVVSYDADAPVMDAAIISEIQKALHFKIACYGTLRTYAKMLDFGNVASEMQSTLDEEKHSDRILSRIADTVNEEALSH